MGRNKIKVSYAPLKNAGDMMNKDLIERLSNKKVVMSKTYNADMIAIGGALIGTQYSNGVRRFLQRLLRIVYKSRPLYVWGAGFWKNDNPNGIFRYNLKVCALRGEKTRQKLSELTGEQYEVPLADAGLLASMFLNGEVKKKYCIGVVPHLSQQNDACLDVFKSNDKYHIIDICNSPENVINEIASCDYILSSSLHGLIFSDSLHIPSLHLILDKQILGGNFKFEDYYSSYGIEDDPWYIENGLPSEKDIQQRYNIRFEDVENKKKQLLECFPRQI